MAIRSVNTELHEHVHTVHGIKDLVLAQNWDVHVLAIKRLVHGEGKNQDILPKDVRTFARNYFKQKKELLFLNSIGERVTVLELKRCSLCEIPGFTASAA